MRARFVTAGLAAVVLGFVAAVSADAAGPPAEGVFSGSLTVKGTYKREGEKLVRITGRNDATGLQTTTSNFVLSLAFSPVKGLFQKRKVLAPTDQNDLFNDVLTLLALDSDTSHPVTLLTATLKGKGTFAGNGSRGKLILKATYSGTDSTAGSGLLPVSGKLKAKFKGGTSGV